MARPITTRPTGRVQTEGRPGTPRLGVYAPSVVRTPGPETDPLHGLGQILGVVGAIGQEQIKQRGDEDFKAGQADEMLGKADMERAERSSRYADGAYEVLILEQYQDAERVVSEKIATELDRGMPISQQTAVIDGWMKSELGPLVADDRAKLLIAKRYADFIDTTGANLLDAQIQDRATRAIEVTQRDALSALERDGEFNWGEYWQRIHSQTGDGAAATATLVGTIAQKMVLAAAEGDPNWRRFRDLIPTEITGPDGKTVRGPLHSPKHADTIHRAMLEAERTFDHTSRREYAGRDFETRVTLDGMLTRGLPITQETFKSLGYTIGPDPSDHLSPAQAAAYIQASERAVLKGQEEAVELQQYRDARGRHGRWADTLRAPGGPDSKDKLQKVFDAETQLLLESWGAGVEQMAGQGLLESPEVLDRLTQWSAQEGMVYTPLKAALSELNQAAPGDIQSRLAAYQAVKAKGQAGMYVSDDTALLYEVAIGAQHAGLKPDQIAEHIRTVGDRDTTSYVSQHMKGLDVRDRGFELIAGQNFFGLNDIEVQSTKAYNAGYLHNRYEQLYAHALSQQLPPDKAKAYAEERIRDTHVGLAVGKGQWAFVPSTAVPNQQEANAALDWYQDQLPKIRKQFDIPEGESVVVAPSYNVQGRRLEFQVMRAGGAVPAGPLPFTLDGLLDVYRRAVPAEARGNTRESVEKTSEERQGRKTLMRSGIDPGIRRNNAL